MYREMCALTWLIYHGGLCSTTSEVPVQSLNGRLVMISQSIGIFHIIFILLSLSCYSVALAPNGPWDTFNVAPASRTLLPVAVAATHGSVANPNHLGGDTKQGGATLHGESWIALDFGKEVSKLAPWGAGNRNSRPQTRLEDT